MISESDDSENEGHASSEVPWNKQMRDDPFDAGKIEFFLSSSQAVVCVEELNNCCTTRQ